MPIMSYRLYNTYDMIRVDPANWAALSLRDLAVTLRFDARGSD